jgi:peptidoglycan hydrolase-like protein with peptidoglycan-binding domain
MRLGQISLASCMILATAVPGFAMTHSRRGPTSPKLFNKRASKAAKPSGQRAIDDSRATVIQSALIKKGYLTGEATGHWDAQTESAMQKMQADNGWQTKMIPDSRAIIKLGLGPNQETSETSGMSGGMENH